MLYAILALIFFCSCQALQSIPEEDITLELKARSVRSPVVIPGKPVPPEPN